MSSEETIILVVDGNRVSRKVYGKLLYKHYEGNCRIVEAATGDSGLQMCRTGEVDCVLIDYHLPDFNGLTFLDLLKKQPENRFTPVVILTGKGDEGTAVQAMKSGAQDYLVKGTFSQDLLGQSILNAIEKVELLKELEQKRLDLERTNGELMDTNLRLKETRQQLLDAAHKAGMADIATSVLHNIGNTLNGVNISVEYILGLVCKSKLRGLKPANDLLGTFGQELAKHPKGEKLMEYYHHLEEAREEEHRNIESETTSLLKKIKLIRDDIFDQKSFVNSETFVEEVDIPKVVDDALSLQQGPLNSLKVKINKVYDQIPTCRLARMKLTHVLVNLIKNSREGLEACSAETDRNNELTIEVNRQDDDHIKIVVRDNGCGIPDEHVDKIFNYGFTTKPNGHGFGLHVAANAMTELGGQISVQNEGEQQGAVFHLILPIG